MTLEKRKKLLRELFVRDQDDSIGVSYLRLSLGASDLSDKSYSYDDGVNNFNLQAGDKEVVPLLKEIIEINPAIGIMASPWSAPPWMKDNGKFIGGSLKPEYYESYAQYFLKYLRAMKAEGIEVQAVTIQNEPLNGNNEPSMLMSAPEQALFIKKYLTTY